jgi:hypothetical protein
MKKQIELRPVTGLVESIDTLTFGAEKLIRDFGNGL